MRATPVFLLAILALAACGEADPVACRCTTLEVGRGGCRNPWPGYNEGIRWHMDLEEACAIARQEGKLIFYFLVVGDLDKSHC